MFRCITKKSYAWATQFSTLADLYEAGYHIILKGATTATPPCAAYLLEKRVWKWWWKEWEV